METIKKFSDKTLVAYLLAKGFKESATDPLTLWKFSHQKGKWISSDAFNKVVSNGKIILQTMWSRYSH